MEFKKTQAGFTLAELMIAVAIVGLLTAAGIGGYQLMRPTRNFHAESRDLISNIQLARMEAVKRGTCVGVVFQAGVGYTVFVDNGAGAGGVACDAVRNGTENTAANTIVNVTIRPEILLMVSPVAASAADRNQNDLFATVSYNQRSLVAARSLVGGPLVLGNALVPQNVTFWSRVVIFPSGGATLQTNNNPANEANWD